MAEINSPGSLLVGEGVFMKGSMQVPGTASIDGKLEGDLTADTVIVQTNGAMDGRTTANHVRVAGSLTNTTVANKSPAVESSGAPAPAPVQPQAQAAPTAAPDSNGNPQRPQNAGGKQGKGH